MTLDRGVIGVTQGRIQVGGDSRLGTVLGLSPAAEDRTGGDFTLYDFFDNIFSFSE